MVLSIRMKINQESHTDVATHVTTSTTTVDENHKVTGVPQAWQLL
jgi:hypothetical protein